MVVCVGMSWESTDCNGNLPSGVERDWLENPLGPAMEFSIPGKIIEINGVCSATAARLSLSHRLDGV